jgi:Na+-translocating ferredoxin:NAD+ oxidoreductase RnfA subunit
MKNSIIIEPCVGYGTEFQGHGPFFGVSKSLRSAITAGLNNVVGFVLACLRSISHFTLTMDWAT